MHTGNHWGGSFELSNNTGNNAEDDDHHRNNGTSEDWDRASLYHLQQSNLDIDHHQQHQQLNDTQRSWLLGPPDVKNTKYVDLGCIICSRKVLKWSIWSFVIAAMVIALPIIIVKTIPKHKSPPPPPDNYTLALHKALLFFNAQKCKLFFFWLRHLLLSFCFK